VIRDLEHVRNGQVAHSESAADNQKGVLSNSYNDCIYYGRDRNQCAREFEEDWDAADRAYRSCASFCDDW
jgi:hypothetical protein